MSRKASQNAQLAKPWGGCATRAEDLIGFCSCQPTTWIWSYKSEKARWSTHSNIISVSTFRTVWKTKVKEQSTRIKIHDRMFKHSKTRIKGHESAEPRDRRTVHEGLTWREKKKNERWWRSIEQEIPPKNVSPENNTTWTLVLLLSRFTLERTFLYEVIHVQYLVSNKFLSDYAGNSRSRRQYYSSVLDWTAGFLSIKDGPAAYCTWARLLFSADLEKGDLRFSEWCPDRHAKYSRTTWPQEVMSSVFTPMLLIWLMYARQGHFQRLKLVRYLGYNPGQTEPSNRWLLNSSSLLRGRYRITHDKQS